MGHKAPFFRTPFNYDTGEASAESALVCEEPSLAKQSFAEECDINTIVRRFNLTGQLPSDVRVPEYGDFDAVYDYHSAMNLVVAANQSFMQMPADIRAKFQNDPAKFLEFVNDAENSDEVKKMGVIPPREPSGAPQGDASTSGDPKATPTPKAAPAASSTGST